ncbi:ribosome biogenesis protein SLX9 homolog [Anabrus simplex]|uniref:ribosome biogenesis protein SLX9 homolog n=1 Tax=Anabrus simplex TaxID=316456 RepID=UPI0035A3C1F2
MGKFKKGKPKTFISKVKSSDKHEDNSEKHTQSHVENYDHGKATVSFNSSTVPFKSKEDTSPKQIPTKISVLLNSRRILKGQTLKKTFKRKLRHTMFLSGMSRMKVREQEASQAKKALQKRRKTPIVGDLQPLVNALPTIKASRPVSKNGKVRKQPHGGICKSQERQESMLQDIAVFQNVLNDPHYQADPGACISKLIQSRMLEEK